MSGLNFGKSATSSSGGFQFGANTQASSAPASSGFSFGPSTAPSVPAGGVSVASSGITASTGGGFSFGTHTAPSVPAGGAGASFSGLIAPAGGTFSFGNPIGTTHSALSFGTSTTLATPAISAVPATGAFSAKTSTSASVPGGFSFGLSSALPSSASLTGATVGSSIALPALSNSAPATKSNALGIVGSTSSITGLTFGVSTSSAALTTTSTSSNLSFGSSLTATGAATSTTVPVLKAMSYKELEETVDKWLHDLNEQEKAFLNQAEQVNIWDKQLIENGEKITELNSEVERVKAEQLRLDRELDFILSQQTDLEELLEPLESQVKSQQIYQSAQHSDIERERTFRLAESVDSQLKGMMQDLREIIEHINSSNIKPQGKADDTMTQIAKILNAHMDSLQWVDQNSTQLQKRVEEVSHSLESRRRDHERFYFPDKRKFELQYAQLYAVRLIMMRPKLVKASERHWGSKCDIKPLADIKENEKCVIIGTLFRKMELQPSILKEISIQGGVLPLPPSNKYIGKEDQLILEEEDQRIALTGDLDFSTAITGTVMAVYGYETDSGKFCVEDHCFVDRLLRNNEVLDGPIQNGEDRFVVFLSGLGIGSKKEDSLKLQLLVDLLSGRLASREEHRKFANVCRVIIAGNSLSRDTQDRDSEKTAKYLSRNTEAKTVVAMKRLDEILFELSSSVPVDIMPGEYDPTNQFLPQQPLHKCMFSKSARNETVQSVPNPYEAMVGGRRILGTSGQNVSNIYQFSGYTDRIEILESTLRRGHISPTSPDTLSCYPYYKEDPFVLNECPNIYFAGNQPKFEVKKITSTMQLIGKLKPKTTNINAMNIFMAFSVLTVFITILYCAFSTKWISDDRYNIERGLWEVCFNTSCYPYNHIVTKAYYQSQSSGPWWLKNGTLPMWLEVSRVTIILSAVTCFVALVLNVVSLLTKIIEMYTGGIFMLLTFGFFAVSVYIFEENIDFRTERCDVGIAWLLGWIAMILSFFTFFMGFCSF